MAPTIRSTAISLLAVAPLWAQLSFAASNCTRDALWKLNEQFFGAAILPNPEGFVMSPNVKITQNTIPMSNILQTAISNITAIPTEWQIQAADETECQISTFTLVEESLPDGQEVNGSTTATALISVRIKSADNDGPPIEVEIVNTTKDKTSPPFWKPEAFPQRAPSIWQDKIDTETPRLSRDQLIAIANTYPSGITLGTGANVPITTDCERLENGASLADVNLPTCAAGFEKFKNDVYSRRWVVDTQVGIVVGQYFFSSVADEPGVGLFLDEYFKVVRGKVARIAVNLQHVKALTKDPWAGGTDLPTASV